MSTYLVLDSNYMCHRVKHALGGLKHGETPTGTVYGFFKSVAILQDQFRTPHVIFCWDSKTNKRKELLPSYKEKRHTAKEDISEEELQFEWEFVRQMKRLRVRYLKMIGFRNIFVQKRLESDDIIASICKRISEEHEAVIVSADKDLYQLLKPNVSFYNPHKSQLYTVAHFRKEYGISPQKWGLVKSIAGCPTDEVPGIPGVGEKTAIKHLLGQLNPETKTSKKIEAEKQAYIKRNKPLVVLPFKGTKRFEIKEDSLSKKGWNRVVKELGMNSFRTKMPFLSTKGRGLI